MLCWGYLAYDVSFICHALLFPLRKLMEQSVFFLSSNLRLMFHNNDNAWHIRHALRYLSAIYSANIECNETINIAQQYPIEASKLHRTKTKRSTSQRFHERQNWCVAACCSHRRRWPIYTKSIFWIVVFRAHNDARCLARGAARSPQGV